MSHRPLYHNATVVLCVCLNAKYANASSDIETKKKRAEESGPPVRLCPVHTRPRQDVNRKKFAHSDVYDTCDLWRAGVDGIANLIYKSKTCDILNILLSNRRNR